MPRASSPASRSANWPRWTCAWACCSRTSPARDLDNPFAIPYVLDALGSTSRAVYPNPARLAAVDGAAADRPHAQFQRPLHRAQPACWPTTACCRKSRPRCARAANIGPPTTATCCATFTQMLHDAEQPMPDEHRRCRKSGADPGAPPVLNFDSAAQRRPAGRHAAVRAGCDRRAAADDPGPDILARTRAAAGRRIGNRGRARPTRQRRCHRRRAARSGTAASADFPSLDPLMALGTSTSLFATLAQWQKLDLARGDRAHGAASRPRATRPQCRRSAEPDSAHPRGHRRRRSPTRPTPSSVDVIGLLFDYIFRDPTIPESTRALFGRLQVPIVKAALLDRTFFSDKKHPARQLLDHLADAAVGAANDDAYREAFEQVARDGDRPRLRGFRDRRRPYSATPTAQLLAFAEPSGSKSADALSEDVAAGAARRGGRGRPRRRARAAARPARRARRARSRCARSSRPIWADYLADAAQGARRRQPAVECRAVDARRHAVEHRRQGAHRAEGAPDQDDSVADRRPAHRLQGAGRSPPSARSRSSSRSTSCTWRRSSRPGTPTLFADGARKATPRKPAAARRRRASTCTTTSAKWRSAPGCSSIAPRASIDARLNWVSPLRAKYIFTSRSRRTRSSCRPRNLAYQLGSGTARLVVEPVPLWDRAVSAALDTRLRRAASRPAPPA